MLEKVVVPLDGSKLAEVALPYAEELAGKMGSEIILLSVLPSENRLEYQKHQTYASRVEGFTRRHIEKYLDRAAGEEIRVGTVTRTGDAAAGILDYAGNGTFKLLVMATHGRSGISRWAVGSVADKIVRSTTRQPMMLIRARGAHPEVRARRILKKALVPLDGSLASEAVVSNVMEIAAHLRMEITLLRVISRSNHTRDEAEAYLQGWCRQFAERNIPAKYEIRAGNAADAIIDVADELAMDMVAMSTRGQNAINLWPLGSVAQKVLLAGNTPLLLVRA
jgi:nucleotide-binding universal stress UspA family protein